MRSWCKHNFNVGPPACEPYLVQRRVLQASPESKQRDCDEYRELQSDPDEVNWKDGGDDVSLKELFEQELLWGRTGNTNDVTEEVLLSSQQLNQALGRAVPVCNKGCVGLIRDLAGDLQAMGRESRDTTSKLAEQEAKLTERNVNIQLLAEETERVSEIQKRSDVKKKKLRQVKKDLGAWESVPKEQSRGKNTLKIEPMAVQATIGRRERVTYDFAERIRNGYPTLKRAQASSCHDWLNASLRDVQVR